MLRHKKSQSCESDVCASCNVFHKTNWDAQCHTRSHRTSRDYFRLVQYSDDVRSVLAFSFPLHPSSQTAGEAREKEKTEREKDGKLMIWLDAGHASHVVVLLVVTNEQKGSRERAKRRKSTRVEVSHFSTTCSLLNSRRDDGCDPFFVTPLCKEEEVYPATTMMFETLLYYYSTTGARWRGLMIVRLWCVVSNALCCCWLRKQYVVRHTLQINNNSLLSSSRCCCISLSLHPNNISNQREGSCNKPILLPHTGHELQHTKISGAAPPLGAWCNKAASSDKIQVARRE